MRRITVLLAIVGAVAGLTLAAAASGGGNAAPKPIVIGTANSLTGFLSTFEQTINNGALLAAEQINKKGGVLGRKITFVRVDAKSDLNQSASAAIEVINKGADVVIPICDADFGGPGARAADKKGVLSITCAGGPGLGRVSGKLVFNTYQGSPTEGATSAEWAFGKRKWRSAYMLCDQLAAYTKVLCEAFKNRFVELGGKIVGEDTFLQSDQSVQTQVTRLKAAGDFDFLFVASFPGGTPVLRQIEASGFDKPIVAAAAFDGDFWLAATPRLSNFYRPSLGSPYGDDPSKAVNSFFAAYKARFGEIPPAPSYAMLGYVAVQTVAQGVRIAKTTNGAKLAAALESFRNVPLLTGPTSYSSTCHIPVGRPYVMMQVKDGRASSLRAVVKATKVAKYPC